MAGSARGKSEVNTVSNCLLKQAVSAYPKSTYLRTFAGD